MTIILFKDGVLASDSMGITGFQGAYIIKESSIMKKIYVSKCKTFAWGICGQAPNEVVHDEIEQSLKERLLSWHLHLATIAYSRLSNPTESQKLLLSNLDKLKAYIDKTYDKYVTPHLKASNVLIITKDNVFDIGEDEIAKGKNNLCIASKDRPQALGSAYKIAYLLSNAGATCNEIIDMCIKHNFEHCSYPLQSIAMANLKPIRINIKTYGKDAYKAIGLKAGDLNLDNI